MASRTELGRRLVRVAEPVGPWRGRKLVALASHPHQLEINAEDREIRIAANGVIDWRGDRPEEADLQSGDQLRWAGITSILTRGAGATPDISIAAAQRPQASDNFLLVDSEDEIVLLRIDGSNAAIAWLGNRPDTDVRVTGARLFDVAGQNELGTITWNSGSPDQVAAAVSGSTYDYTTSHEALIEATTGIIYWYDGRPAAEYRQAGATLRSHNGQTSYGPITWNDSGDTTTAPQNADLSWNQLRGFDGSGEATLSSGVLTISNPSAGFPEAKVGDRFILNNNAGELRRTCVIDTKTSNTSFAVTVTGGGDFSSTHYRLERNGRRIAGGYIIRLTGISYTGYEIRQTGFRIRDWQLWSNGSYYGEGGVPDAPVPFGLRVADIGSQPTKTVVLVDAHGNEHSWNPSADGDWFPDADNLVLVQEVAHGSNIVSYYAYFL